MAAKNIKTGAGRSRLGPRREPYFVRIAKGQHLGYRKSASGGTWIAKVTSGKVRRYRPLGSERDLPEYGDALEASLAWFREVNLEEGPDATRTVKDAIADYVRDVRVRRSSSAATRTEQLANRHILPSLGGVELSKLTSRRLKAWRDGLVPADAEPEKIRSAKNTANRILTVLKAALNMAFRDGVVRSDAAWRRISPFPDVNRARDVFLSVAQCQHLLDACPSDFRLLVRSALVTGARYGELVRRTVGELDIKQGVLHVPDGKTGARDIVLSDAALAHFRVLAKDKLPGALLHYREQVVEDEIRLVPWGPSEQIRRMKAAVRSANHSAKKSERLPAATCFYSLRHTHASLALLAGVNLQVLAENMGTSVRMLEKHYGKFLRADRRAMFNTVDLP